MPLKQPTHLITIAKKVKKTVTHFVTKLVDCVPPEKFYKKKKKLNYFRDKMS